MPANESSSAGSSVPVSPPSCGIVEEDRARRRQVECGVPVGDVGGDDAAEREAEIAGTREPGLDAMRVGAQELQRAADAAHCRGDAGLDVEGSGTGHGDVGLVPRVHDDRPGADGVPDELVHLVVPGELVVAVHDDRDRRGPRGGGDGFEHVPRVAPDPAGADAPVAVAVRRAARARRGCFGWVAVVTTSGWGGRVVAVDDRGAALAAPPFAAPHVTASTATTPRVPRRRRPDARARPCVRCVRRSCRRSRPMAGHSTVAAPGEPAATAPRRPARARAGAGHERRRSSPRRSLRPVCTMPRR